MDKALRRAIEAHETDVARLQLQLGEKDALVAEAAKAAAPLYMWPSADGMGALRSKYDQLHLAHTHLQAVVSGAWPLECRLARAGSLLCALHPRRSIPY